MVFYKKSFVCIIKTVAKWYPLENGAFFHDPRAGKIGYPHKYCTFTATVAHNLITKTITGTGVSI